MEPECRIRLEVFEGPLDLLLHLITRNRLDITEISISLVTNQYLEYLEFLKTLDIEVAAEYLVMAATLMQLKSAMVLPKTGPPSEEEHSAMDIVGSLEELKRIKLLAELLEKRPILERDVFLSRGDMVVSIGHTKTEEQAKSQNEGFDVGILDLMDAFKRVVGKKNMPKTMEILKARVDLEGRIEEIEHLLRERKKLYFNEFFEPETPRHMLIATFLAILELAKRGISRLIQEANTNRILLVYKPRS